MTIHLNEDVMEAASVFLAGKRLVHGLGFMQRVPYADNITGAQANCVFIKVPRQPGFAGAEPVLRFPRMVYPDNGDPDEGIDLIFRQTPRPEIVR